MKKFRIGLIFIGAAIVLFSAFTEAGDFHWIGIALMMGAGLCPSLWRTTCVVFLAGIVLATTGCASRSKSTTRAYYPDGKLAVENYEESRGGGSSWGGGGNFFHFRVGGAPGYGPSPVYVAPPVYVGPPIGLRYHY